MNQLHRSLQNFIHARFKKLGDAINRQREAAAQIETAKKELAEAEARHASASRKVQHEEDFGFGPEAVHWWFTKNGLDPWTEGQAYVEVLDNEGAVDEDFKFSLEYLLLQPKGTKSFPGYREWLTPLVTSLTK